MQSSGIHISGRCLLPLSSCPAAALPSRHQSPSPQHRLPGCTGDSAQSHQSSGQTWRHSGWWWVCGQELCMEKDIWGDDTLTNTGGAPLMPGQEQLSQWSQELGPPGPLVSSPMLHRDKPRLSTMFFSLRHQTSLSHPVETLESLHTSFAKSHPLLPLISAAGLSSDTFQRKSAEKSFLVGQ